MEYMETRVTAQDLYIRDLEHCVRELQRIVDRLRSSAVPSSCLLPDDLCDILVPRAPFLPAPSSHVKYNPLDTVTLTGDQYYA